MHAPKTALIVGQSGTIGHAMAKHLACLPDWNVVTLGRKPSDGLDAPHIALDLCRDDLPTAAEPLLSKVTHIFNCARAPAADPDEERRLNERLLKNLLDLAEARAELEHVCLIHGTKWYGCHTGPYRTPALEDDPPAADPSFYAVQQDLIQRRQDGKAWSWSALRPHTIWGLPARSGNSIVVLIAAYALLMKASGQPLHFPGPAKTFEKLSQATDSDLLNRAMVWAATTPAARNQPFNITNGDFFRWERLWPSVADFFEMECGEVRTIRLAEAMPALEGLWPGIVEAHGLAFPDIRSIVKWAYGDAIFDLAWTDMSSTVKARAGGFADAIDSGDALLKSLHALRRHRYSP